MLNSRGIKLIIGPMGSGEVANIRNYVTQNQIIIISPSSTAMTEPKLIIMDEPIAGVAPALAHDILNRVVELKRKGITFL